MKKYFKINLKNCDDINQNISKLGKYFCLFFSFFFMTLLSTSKNAIKINLFTDYWIQIK